MPEPGASTKPDLAQAMNQLDSALDQFKVALRATAEARAAFPAHDLAQAMNLLESTFDQFKVAMRSSPEARAAEGPVFAALRKWRSEQARTRQLPPYVIASDAVLRAIVEAKPADLEQLQAIRGIGANKAATYGPDILQVVATAA